MCNGFLWQYVCVKYLSVLWFCYYIFSGFNHMFWLIVKGKLLLVRFLFHKLNTSCNLCHLLNRELFISDIFIAKSECIKGIWKYKKYVTCLLAVLFLFLAFLWFLFSSLLKTDSPKKTQVFLQFSYLIENCKLEYFRMSIAGNTLK